MAFIFRSAVATRSAAVAAVARPAVASSALRFAPRALAPSLTPSLASLRFSSSSSSAASGSEPAAPPPESHSSSAVDTVSGEAWSGLTFSDIPSDAVRPYALNEDDPDAWWRKADMATIDRNHARPGNQYTGRSRAVKGDYGKAYSFLNGMLSRTKVRVEIKRGEFYERPSQRRVRLRMERIRRRFQEEVRTRVHLVQDLRSRK